MLFLILFINNIILSEDSKNNSEYYEDIKNWDKTFNYNNSYDGLNDLIIDKNDSIYLIGSCRANYEIKNNQFDDNWWIKKFIKK